MRVLVAYASKYGATKEIAHVIAEKLQAAGLQAEALPVESAKDASSYDAFVIGSAVYYGSWLKDGEQFVRRNREVLAQKPVWLFSTGPLTTEEKDSEGHDVREEAEPKEMPEFEETIHPKDHKVFFGEMDVGKLKFVDRVVAKMPAFPGKEGDFRDWDHIEAWTDSISRNLKKVPAGKN